MSWYNPLTWFAPDDATGEANSYRLLMEAQEQLGAGIITPEQYLHLYNTYVSVYGSVPASAAEAAARSQKWMDDLMDGVIRDTATGTLNDLAKAPVTIIKTVTGELPAWVKIAAIAGVSLLAIHVLTNAGILGKAK